MTRVRSRSVAAFLLTLFTGLALAAAILPGCGDDSGRDSDTLIID